MDSVAHMNLLVTGSCSDSTHELSAGKDTPKRVDKSRKNKQNKKIKVKTTSLLSRKQQQSSHSEPSLERPHALPPHHLVRKWRHESIQAFISTEGKTGRPSAAPYTVQQLLPYVPRKEAVRLAHLSVPLPTPQSVDLATSLLESQDLKTMNQYHQAGFRPHDILGIFDDLWPSHNQDSSDSADKSSVSIIDVTPAVSLIETPQQIIVDDIPYRCESLIPRTSGLNSYISLNNTTFEIENGLVIDPSGEFSDCYLTCQAIYFEYGGGVFFSITSPVLKTSVETSISFVDEYCEEYILEVFPTNFQIIEHQTSPPQYAEYSKGPRLLRATYSNVPLEARVLPFLSKYVSLVFVLTLSFARNRMWDISNEPTVMYITTVCC